MSPQLFVRLVFSALLVFSVSGALAGAYEDVIDAIKVDDVVTVQKLIGRGVTPDTVDTQGNALLTIAAREGSLKAVRLLLAAHAQVDAANLIGETPIMHAAIRGHLEIVRALLVQGAAVNRQGWTPLIYAAVKGDIPVARLLLAYGAQIDGSAPNGLTALMMAAREGHQELVEFLLRNHADPNAATDTGLTALALARKGDRQAIVDLLLKAGAK